jgi:hypothetical protein
MPYAWPARIAAASLLALSACASAPRVSLRVDPVALARVPEPFRSHLGEKESHELDGARAELTRASGEIEPAAHAIEAARGEQKQAAAATAQKRLDLDAANKSGDGSRMDQAKLDLVVAEEAEHVEAAKVTWLEATHAWRVRAREAAEARVAAADAKLELARAEAAAQRGAELELPPFRGQQARFHLLWSEACTRLATAHAAVDAKQKELMQLKARYAEARRVVLPKPVVEPAEPPSLSGSTSAGSSTGEKPPAAAKPATATAK